MCGKERKKDGEAKDGEALGEERRAAGLEGVLQGGAPFPLVLRGPPPQAAWNSFSSEARLLSSQASNGGFVQVMGLPVSIF